MQINYFFKDEICLTNNNHKSCAIYCSRQHLSADDDAHVTSIKYKIVAINHRKFWNIQNKEVVVKTLIFH